MTRHVVVDAKGAELKVGQRVVSFRNEIYEYKGFKAPQGPSNGRVIVRPFEGPNNDREIALYPSVFDLKIREIEE